MIERNKMLIIITTIYVIALNIVAVILTFALKNNDLVPVFNIVGTLGYLLFINIRSMRTDKIKFKDKVNNRENNELYNSRKESQRVSFILFLIKVVITIIVCVIFFTR